MRNVLRLKLLVAKILCHAAVGRLLRRRGRVQRLSGVLVDLAHVTNPETVAQLQWGLYESAELRLIDRHLDNSYDVIELGASIGVTSVHIARRLKGRRRLVCVEANPRLIQPLAQMLARNAVSAEVVHAAIAYGTATIGFEAGLDTTSGRVNSTSNTAEVVRTASLGELCERYRITDFTLVADIEGAEAEILQHEQQTLERCQQILIELHDTRDDAGRVVSISELTARIVALGFVVDAGGGPVLGFRKKANFRTTSA